MGDGVETEPGTSGGRSVGRAETEPGILGRRPGDRAEGPQFNSVLFI